MQNPFTPGTGNFPTYFAGREEEKALLGESLQAINGDRRHDGRLAGATCSPVRVVGPRGSGKTTLLTWLSQRARERRTCVFRCPHMKEGRKEGDVFASFIGQLANRETGVTSKTAAEFSIPKIVSYKKEKIKESESNYRDALRARLEAEPVVMLFDETQHFDPDLLAMILQANQEEIAEGFPLLAVLAGTPQIEGFLTSIDATFMNRSRPLNVNTISEEAALAALRKPLAALQIEVEEEALELLAGATDCFPYFVQIAGDEVWREMKREGGKGIDVAMAAKAVEATKKQRDIFYDSIYQRMFSNGLMDHAKLVVEMMAAEGVQRLRYEHVTKRLREHDAGLDHAKACAAVDGMLDWSFLWKEGEWLEPAIPSFTSYLGKRVMEKS